MCLKCFIVKCALNFNAQLKPSILIMGGSTCPLLFCPSYRNMVFCLGHHVFTLHNKMVLQNERTVTFLKSHVPFFLVCIYLSIFEMTLFLLPLSLLIVFPHVYCLPNPHLICCILMTIHFLYPLKFLDAHASFKFWMVVMINLVPGQLNVFS